MDDDLFRRYEYTFLVSLMMTGKQERRLASVLGFRTEQRNGLFLLTATATAMSASSAGRDLADLLAEHSVTITRTHPDFVARQDIADRAGVTRQAVGQWIRGDRQRRTPFPDPINAVANGIWLWGDIYCWLREHHYGTETVQHYPTLEDHVRVDRYIEMNHRDTKRTAAPTR